VSRADERRAGLAQARELIITALVYPRQLMQGSIALEGCAHAGHYAPRQPDCNRCEHSPECEWLIGHDQHVDLRRKSVDALTEALEISFSYVDARVTLDGHNARHCRCEACGWLRETERLLEMLR